METDDPMGFLALIVLGIPAAIATVIVNVAIKILSTNEGRIATLVVSGVGGTLYYNEVALPSSKVHESVKALCVQTWAYHNKYSEFPSSMNSLPFTASDMSYTYLLVGDGSDRNAVGIVAKKNKPFLSNVAALSFYNQGKYSCFVCKYTNSSEDKQSNSPCPKGTKQLDAFTTK